MKIFLVIVALSLIGLFTALIIISRKVNVKDEDVIKYNYFLMEENGKNGIIDRSGNIIVNPEYDYIQIPNPEKPIFICLTRLDIQP